MLLWQLRGISEGQDGRVDAIARVMGYMAAKRVECLEGMLCKVAVIALIGIVCVTIPRGL